MLPSLMHCCTWHCLYHYMKEQGTIIQLIVSPGCICHIQLDSNRLELLVITARADSIFTINLAFNWHGQLMYQANRILSISHQQQSKLPEGNKRIIKLKRCLYTSYLSHVFLHK